MLDFFERQRSIAKHPRPTHECIQWRAEFVGDSGEKHVLRAICVVGDRPCSLFRLKKVFPVTDVYNRTEHKHLAVKVNWIQADFNRDFAPVLAHSVEVTTGSHRSSLRCV